MAPTVKEYMKEEIAKRKAARSKDAAARIIKENITIINKEKKRTTK